MAQVEHYQSPVATVEADASCRDVADTLKARGVGSLVVVEDGKPVGILTDRDLMCRVIAAGRDAGPTVARDVMSEPLISVAPDQALEHVVDAMAAQGIRRVPVLRDGELVGIVSLDDLLASLSDELADLAEGARRGFRVAQRSARARGLAEELEGKVREWGEELERLGEDAGEKLRHKLESLRDRIRRRED
jgi:CBS domain-containing protein